MGIGKQLKLGNRKSSWVRPSRSLGGEKIKGGDMKTLW
jgi:hypothetical protein